MIQQYRTCDASLEELLSTPIAADDVPHQLIVTGFTNWMLEAAEQKCMY